MQKLLLTTLLLSLFGCNSDDGAPTAEQCNASLERIWIYDDSIPTVEADLRNVVFNEVSEVAFDVYDGTALFSCSASYYATGNGCSGQWVTSNAAITSGTGDCSILNGSGTFSTSGNILQICDDNPPCANYEGQ